MSEVCYTNFIIIIGGYILRKVTFLIGNGFDISLGLKTSFTNFLMEIMKDKAKVEGNLIYSKACADYDEGDINWSNLEEKIGDVTRCFEGDSHNEENNFLRSLDELYADLEKYLRKEFIGKGFPENMDEIFLKDIINFHEELPSIESSAIKRKVWDFGETYPKISITFVIFNYSTFIDDFFKKNRFPYNYGKTYNNLIAVQKDIVHIHGKLGDQIILGINDEEQCHKNTPDDVKREIIKSQLNTDNSKGDMDRATIIVNSSDVIVILGMSLGNTDKMWWELIGKKMLQEDLHVVIFWYEEKFEKGAGPKFNRKRREIESLFLKRLSLKEDELNKVKKNIFVCINQRAAFKYSEHLIVNEG